MWYSKQSLHFINLIVQEVTRRRIPNIFITLPQLLIYKKKTSELTIMSLSFNMPLVRSIFYLFESYYNNTNYLELLVMLKLFSKYQTNVWTTRHVFWSLCFCLRIKVKQPVLAKLLLYLCKLVPQQNMSILSNVSYSFLVIKMPN